MFLLHKLLIINNILKSAVTNEVTAEMYVKIYSSGKEKIEIKNSFHYYY